MLTAPPTAWDTRAPQAGAYRQMADLVAAITQPTLILAWTDDPGRPPISAERLAETLPNAVLEVAATHEQYLTWGRRAAEFVTAS